MNELNGYDLGVERRGDEAGDFPLGEGSRVIPASPETEGAAYQALGPDQVLDALEGLGWRCDGRLLALNSYENRVYQVGVEDGSPVIAKFYRPGRWTDAAILEEHAFSRELAARDIPAVPPLEDAAGATLHHAGAYRVAVYPRRGGRAPELERLDNLEVLGRHMGRIHAMGAVRGFRHRPTLSVESFGERSRAFLLAGDWLPADLLAAYESVSRDALERVRLCWERAGDHAPIRLHGDAHPGNILWRDDAPHFVDFDDARMGPAVQDLWMFLSGDRPERTAQLDAILEGYGAFLPFPMNQRHLIEALRTLRIMRHTAWIARRWDDPAFPQAFPYFNEQRYWQEHILSLREQIAAMDEPPLSCGAFG